MIELVGFDADDTLWHSEPYFQDAHAQFERILGNYLDLADARVHERLLATERRNIKLFGYGAKGMTLSLIETAIELTDAAISGRDVQALIELGKGILTHPVELLPGAREAVAAADAECACLFSAAEQLAVLADREDGEAGDDPEAIGALALEAAALLERARVVLGAKPERIRDASGRTIARVWSAPR